MLILNSLTKFRAIVLLCDTSNDDDPVICFVFKQSTNTFSLGTIGSYIKPLSVVFLSSYCVGMLSLVYMFTSDVVLMVGVLGIHHQFGLMHGVV